MSTSCVIAICNKKREEIVLLEKTHDGILDNFVKLVEKAKKHCFHKDVEELANYLIKNTDIDFSIYSHKYPYYAYIYLVDRDEFIETKINSDIEKIYDCLEDVKNAIA